MHRPYDLNENGKKSVLKTLFIVALVLLGACSGKDPERQACLDAMERMSLKGAYDSAVAPLIGQKGVNITSVVGYATIRMLAPNGVRTMDYRSDRINLYVDCDGNIIATTVG